VQDARRDFAQAHHVQVLAREQFMHLRNRQDSAQAIVDDLLDSLVARVVHLQAHQAGDLLQVVFHAVVHLLQDCAAHHEFGVVNRERGLAGDRFEGA
jgi:hypothetical protein